MSRILFITGTDTGVGKTVLTGLLLAHLRQTGNHALALKPFCSGSRDDAKLLHALQDRELTLDRINPFFFPEPLAPLAAARKRRSSITLKSVLGHIGSILSLTTTPPLHHSNPPILLVEGVGGLLVPLGKSFAVLDLITGLASNLDPSTSSIQPRVPGNAGRELRDTRPPLPGPLLRRRRGNPAAATRLASQGLPCPTVFSLSSSGGEGRGEEALPPQTARGSGVADAGQGDVTPFHCHPSLDVIIVARNQLGTLNHTLLTVRALQQTLLSPAGLAEASQRKRKTDVGAVSLRVVLMDPRTPDASTFSNPRLLSELLSPVPVFRLPWLGPRCNTPTAIKARAAKLRGSLARLLG
jgi:dethiobiotin synthase